MKRQLLSLALAAAAALSVAPATALATGAPALMLANVYRAGIDLSDYWVSEKYDGVRGYWDGKQLLTRGGEAVAAPAWFTQGWPAVPMDGELWAGRGHFSQAVSTVRTQRGGDAAWHQMRFMVFDLPAHGGMFSQRIPAIETLVSDLHQGWVQAVPQRKVASHAELRSLLKATARAGGEGLMLHRGASLYQTTRNDDLLKLKEYLDAEARVLAVLPGKGKYAGMMGALLVEAIDGRGQPGPRFKIGTGFSDLDRRDPPAIGALITYRYRDLNPSGIPRFASFLRLRSDMTAGAPAR